MNFYCTGDCHGRFERFDNFYKTITTPVGMICLGDFGVNYYLNKRDEKNKAELCSKYPLITFYCVRGNHEARPQDIEGMTTIYDKNVDGTVYYQPKYPNIRYLWDGEEKIVEDKFYVDTVVLDTSDDCITFELANNTKEMLNPEHILDLNITKISKTRYLEAIKEDKHHFDDLF